MTMRQVPAIPAVGTANPSRVTLTALDETSRSALFARTRPADVFMINGETDGGSDRRRGLSIADLAVA